MRKTTVIFLLPFALGLAGCVTYVRPETRMSRRATPPSTPSPAPQPAPEREDALYDGRTGRLTTLDAFVARTRDVDVIAFGELHDNLVGARYQLEVLRAMAAQGRPVALAMEFFEADQQADLDAYLSGTLDRETFLERTRRSGSYPKTHGPLVEWAKENGAAVIAANAPRRLVSAYRKHEGGYADYLATLSEEERAWLPDRTTTPEDDYWRRFEEVMGGGPRAAQFFRAQALWDDAMADRVARFRDARPDTRVLLVVGAFHVEGGLGTITKYGYRRPQDRVATLQMEMDADATLPFREEDRGKGDVVLKVRRPAPPERPDVHP